jgi:hypothetical protein
MDVLQDQHTKTGLTWLWVFMLFNYVYGDLIMVFTVLSHPRLFERLQQGFIGHIHLSDSFMIWGAVAMEISLVMVPLSWFLAKRTNRIVQIAGGLLNGAIQVALLGAGNIPSKVAAPAVFQFVELITAIVIIAIAWRWRDPVSGGEFS